MSDFDAGADPLPEQETTPIPPLPVGDHPARHLLAHDLEHLVWDEDVDDSVPPPD